MLGLTNLLHRLLGQFRIAPSYLSDKAYIKEQPIIERIEVVA